ncbi:hypothetical protein A3Q56_07960 [Intoshia linei]|uniref:Alphavirus-like MT domain-containing protein n=1 Tax=Intoshia linei TaxID=1819745 RepID=A0A177ASH7_9BILA|nr:hypothetical protein A3Q56_07960 [Intoshia linei]
MFHLDFSHANDNDAHGYARATRKLGEAYMYRKMHITDRTALMNKNYDVLIKDVGAFPVVKFKKDDFKRSKYLHELRVFQLYPDTKPNIRKAYMVHVENDRNALCCNVSQNCTITAPYVIFNHSTYNMTLDNITLTMVNSDANVAYGCVIFHQDVFIFWFDNDVQAGYDHYLATYVSLLKTIRLKYRKNNEMLYYNLQLDSIHDDVLYFCIYRSFSGDVPASISFNVITSKSSEKK